MSELKRAILGGPVGDVAMRRWVVSGPDGAVALHILAEYDVVDGLYVHSRTELDGEERNASCDVLDGAPCWGFPLSQSMAREAFAAVLVSDDAVFAQLELRYRGHWPSCGRRGESVPQAGGAS